MKPESKISGFIGRHLIMASISGQDTAAEQLYVKSPDGYVPPVLMQVDPDK